MEQSKKMLRFAASITMVLCAISILIASTRSNRVNAQNYGPSGGNDPYRYYPVGVVMNDQQSPKVAVVIGYRTSDNTSTVLSRTTVSY